MTSIASKLASTSKEKRKRAGFLERTFHRWIQKKLDSMGTGSVHLEAPSPPKPIDSLTRQDQHRIEIQHPAFYRRVLLGGSLGAAESYVRGEWQTDDLVGLMRLFVNQLKNNSRISGKLSFASETLSRLSHWFRSNSQKGSQKNISAHYDLGNDFFRLMLDPSMTYSCGYFSGATEDLSEAQTEKYERLCKLLELSANDHLLEIGTGWGGMAIHAATRYGCRVTSTTISKEQYQYASARIAELGLQNQVNVVLVDYRNLDGPFDKLVSIEMIEAVGHQYLPTYFQKCAELLKPKGLFALQAISMPEAAYNQYLRRADFIQKYIFPGSCCPSFTAMAKAFSLNSNFVHEQSENIGLHYTKTLRLWRNRFESNLPEIRALGYSDEFIRLWHYYLCYCEAGFAEKYLANFQILLSKGLPS
ncbi:MAG: cyclopropane-fatty-acyl-phospholipid synthase family protein [Planctomycetota bacterium]|nr:cyclopropane-fatty-acyl-phospholipid synthase family protein [Planctomycetota bacterium]